jgi:cysteine-rich repeat protein
MTPSGNHCYNVEPGCYSGTAEPSVGETMSYCHLNGSVEMGFRDRVGEQIRSESEALAGCLTPKGGVCGDGILDTGEECDDGDLEDDDCCSSLCVLLSATSAGCEDGSFCTDDYACADSTCYYKPHLCDDGNPCTHEYCDDVLDSCESVDRTGRYDDGLYCTYFEECTAGACGGGVVRTCEDGTACTSDFCDEANDVCVNTVLPPSATCDLAGNSQLSMKIAGTESFVWKWSRGPAIDATDIGTPGHDVDSVYSLCFYDETDQLITHFNAGVSSILWTPVGNGGFKYRDSTKYYSPNYLTAMSFKPGAAQKGKLGAKGERDDFDLPALPVTAGTLRVQLRRGNASNCWESVFVPPFDVNTSTQFKDKATQ